MGRVLGIDPGYGRCGVAVVERVDGKDTLLTSYCIETDATTPFQERLRVVIEKVSDTIIQYTPLHIALEQVFFSKNQKTALRVAEVRGAILSLAAARGIPVIEYNPGRVKVAITGDGKAQKPQIMKMVRLLIRQHSVDMLDDEYDAIALALTHLAEHR